MATKKTKPEHVETVDPSQEPGVVDLSDADSPLVTIGEPTNQPTNQPTGIVNVATITLSIVVPIEHGEEVDFAPLVEAVAEMWPGATVAELPADDDGIFDGSEEIPPGHAARTIILSDEQWGAVDRQATRNKSTASQWLRRFLHPYLRRG